MTSSRTSQRCTSISIGKSISRAESVQTWNSISNPGRFDPPPPLYKPPNACATFSSKKPDQGCRLSHRRRAPPPQAADRRRQSKPELPASIQGHQQAPLVTLLLPEVANLAPDHQIIIPPKLAVDRPLFLVASSNQACASLDQPW